MSGSDWIDLAARQITIQIMKERSSSPYRSKTLEEWEAIIRRCITEALPEPQKTL